MNVLVFMTDQQRAIQHFPPGWAKRNMPGLTRLQKHGMTFENAFTNACMCSPARSTLMSGYFPAQHGVKYTLETDMPAPQYPQVELATSFKNPATVVAAAGYTPGLQGQVPLRQAGERLDLRPRGRQPVRLHPLGSAGRGRQPGHLGGGRRDLRQRRPLHELPGHARGGHRGRPPVPELDRRAAASRSSWSSRWSTRTTCSSTRRPTPPAATTTPGCRARSSRRRRRTRTCRRSRRVQEQFLQIFNLSGPDPDAADEAQLPELLRQPDEGLGRLPGEDPRHARRRPACSTTRS